MTPRGNPELLEVDHLRVSYVAGRRRTEVVHDATFSVARGETLALVGESGSGKTSVARAIAGLVPAQGVIRFGGRDINRPVGRRSKQERRGIQYVFQNPDASLNPRRKVSYLIGRPISFFFGVDGREVRLRVAGLLEDVHLDPRYADRYPADLSGGERQRVAIAQALAADPDLILCDEIVSALDVSVQAAILDLLREIQSRRGVSYLFIAHDLAVVRWLAHRVLVLYQGLVLESGSPADVFRKPNHPYTEALIASVPEAGPRRMKPVADEGQTGSLPGPEGGCPFVPRCPYRIESVCAATVPPWYEASSAHTIRCQHEPTALADRQHAAAAGAPSASGTRP